METSPLIFGRVLWSISASGLSSARLELYLKSRISRLSNGLWLFATKMGGKFLHLGHCPVGFGDLQFGQKLVCPKIMLFLQRWQSGSPRVPQPLQEWGAIRSKKLGSVVFFTIKLIFLLILL